MSTTNELRLLGHLTRDCELRYTPNGKAMVFGTVATTYRYKPKDGDWKEAVRYVGFQMWDKRAEAFEKHHGKGSQCFLVGHVSDESWDGKDGKKVYKTQVTVVDWEFVTSDPGPGDGKDVSGPYDPAPPGDVDDTPF